MLCRSFSRERGPTTRSRVVDRLLIAISLTVIGVSFAGAADTARTCVTDFLLRRVCTAGPVERVVSLAPSLTECVFALGCGDRLVGRTTRCNNPPEAKNVPVVGAYMRPDLERLIAAAPDLVVTTKAGASKEVARRIKSFGAPVFVSDCESIDDVAGLIDKLGVLLDCRDRAGHVVKEMRRRRAAVRAECEGLSRPTVLFAVGIRPLVAAGGSSFVGALIRDAGGVNILEDVPGRYPKVNLEHVIRADPDVVITLDKECGTAKTCEEYWLAMPTLKAVRNGRLVFMDGDLMARPSPRIITALEELAEALHPEVNLRSHLDEGSVASGDDAP